MRILFFGNNRLGFQILKWLLESDEKIVGAVLHPRTRAKYLDEMMELAQRYAIPIFEGSHLSNPVVIDSLREVNPDIGISILFGYILKQAVLDLLANGCINLHPSYLPYNRGAFPNVWSIVEGTPAGATLHYIDRGIDTGDILARVPVKVEPFDTGASLYAKLEDASLELFKKTWPEIRSANVERIPQQPNQGTMHRVKDVEQIDEIDLNKSYLARDLINILRARTFSPHNGAFFLHNGRKIFMRLELSPSDEEEKPT